MEAGSLPEALQLIMYERSWTQSRLASELGEDKAWVSRVLSGKKDPSVGRVVHLLSRVGWEVRMRPGREDDPVDRREFIAGAAAATFGERVAGVFFLPPRTSAPYRNPEYVAAIAGRLHRLRHEVGGIPLLSEAAHHMREIQPALGAQGGKLNAAISQLARASSLVFHDAERIRLAARAGETALVSAHKSGVAEEVVHSRELIAQMLSQSDAPVAIAHARRGIRVPGIAPEEYGRLQSRHAVALTYMKGIDPGDVRAVADDAQAAVADIASTRVRAVVAGSVGIALSRLGYSQEAAGLLESTTRFLGSSPQPAARWLAQKVMADLRARNLPMAAEDMNALANVAPLVKSGKLAVEMAVLLKLSATYDSSELTEARERLRHILEPD